MKKILDACCGSRMCWFDKDNPDTVFMDCRSEEHTLCDGRRLEIRPDVVGDFRKMPFPDNSFYLVLFDPPHLNNLGESSWLAKKYGRLLPSWEDDIRQGFEECMRVLKPTGTLIFKWNEQQIPTARIIEIIGQKPLFGHTSGKCGECAFFKNEDANGYGHCIITLNQYRCDDLCKFKEDHMSDVETLRALHHYQKWRRGGNGRPPHPFVIGQTIDNAIRTLRRITKDTPKF